MSQNLGPLKLSAAELASVQEGLTDGVLGRTPKVDLETYGPKLQEFAKGRLARGGRRREEGRCGLPREGSRAARRRQAADRASSTRK